MCIHHNIQKNTCKIGSCLPKNFVFLVSALSDQLARIKYWSCFSLLLVRTWFCQQHTLGWRGSQPNSNTFSALTPVYKKKKISKSSCNYLGKPVLSSDILVRKLYRIYHQPGSKMDWPGCKKRLDLTFTSHPCRTHFLAIGLFWSWDWKKFSWYYS